MTDFRALCAELIRVNDDTEAGDWCRAWDDVTDRARAALAEQPVGPTDEELLRIYGVATPCYQVKEHKRELDFARAVLACWGQPAATPIPVAERLPGPEDLDREGTCWMFHPINLHYCLCVPDPSIHTHWLPANALSVPTNV